MTVRASLRNVSVAFGSVKVLNDVHLDVEPGEFLALLGPSGSGKTTALNVLAGFVRPSVGTVEVDGRDVSGTRPAQRDIGVVFQGYALFPHMSVAENVAFPLKMRGVDRASRDKRTKEALALVGLKEHGDRAIITLSGGQKQRVALARAIVFEPKILLLDEPLGALDKQLREAMQLEIKRLQRRLEITTISVTHDQIEALTMADKIAVMRNGHVEQIASPEAIYHRPQTSFVATFLGEANLIPVESGHLLGFGKLQTEVSGSALVRPEQFTIRQDDNDGTHSLSAKAIVEEATFQGERFRTRVRLCSGGDIMLTLSQQAGPHTHRVVVGSVIDVFVSQRSLHLIDEPVPTIN